MSAIDQAALAEVSEALTDPMRRALLSLSTGDYATGPHNLALELGVSIGEARATLQHFRDQGICVFGPTYDEDRGDVCGSGYWLGPFGQAVREKVLIG